MPVTLKDVAARAGVSVGTASNAFNRPETVAEDTRGRVAAAAAELGYGGPDPIARRLRTRLAGAVGVVFTDRLSWAFSDPAAAEFLRGVAEGVEARGASLLIVPTGPSRADAARVVREAPVDGVIVYSVPERDPRLAAASARRLPTVIVDQTDDGSAPFVGIDDEAATRAAATYVRGLGHERIAVLAFPERAEDALPFPVTRARLAGYGVPDVVTCPRNDVDTGRAAALAALGADPRPTALLAMSDALAAGALRAAADLGLDVPRDVSVVGFDDAPSAAVLGLTTIRQPTAEKGRIAAARLAALAEGRTVRPRRTLLPTELVVRRTTAST